MNTASKLVERPSADQKAGPLQGSSRPVGGWMWRSFPMPHKGRGWCTAVSGMHECV